MEEDNTANAYRRKSLASKEDFLRSLDTMAEAARVSPLYESILCRTKSDRELIHVIREHDYEHRICHKQQNNNPTKTLFHP